MPAQAPTKKFFSLEEAVALLPFVRATFAEAHKAMLPLRDEVILYKRLQQSREEEALDYDDPDLVAINQILEEKISAYEDLFRLWIGKLTDKGIQVKQFEKGLIDFPYRSADTGEEYLLCWHLKDDGLFYFHGPNEGFAGRKPITLLPE
ncbi:MAG: DUF2203 domain-containing protein [Cyanobacteria bacterium HKST-UBA04]|nr:DUF2203 domain-containing protein [Cyanobacteria bacterium HKST-UBA04]MCA9841613.1 DUF2203 domain-containing protein [Cyanobacteria bacterium HKST-UBA03]